MQSYVVTIKKSITIFLVIVVSILTVIAIYSNRHRFYSSGTEIIKYSQVTVDERFNLNDVVEKYSDSGTRTVFISELKKVNNISTLSDDSIYGKTIYIPVISN